MKSVEDYMNLPYNCIVQQINDESGTYFYAHVLELAGCQSTGGPTDSVLPGHTTSREVVCSDGQ